MDWVNQMLYWTDARAKRIEVFDLEKGHRRLLITTGEGTLPRTIIVDPTTRSLDNKNKNKNYIIDGNTKGDVNRGSLMISSLPSLSVNFKVVKCHRINC